MLSAPAAAMLDSKLFAIRDNGAFRGLFERWWDGDEWVWVNHGRPDDRPLKYAPGAAMMNEKLFVVVDDGRLWERHWRNDLGRWAWQDHGRPENRPVVAAPGAAMMDSKLFVVVDDGRLWERHWRPDLGRWAWQDHGRPPGTSVATAPGAAMMNQKLFVGAADGRLFERFWDGGAWVWVDHGRPPGTSVATEPGAAMMSSKLFVGTANGHMFERLWNGTAWVWVDHGSALHDQSQHVVGAPGAGPKLTVAVMGDGFTEGDLDDYHKLVEDRVLKAFRSDQLGNHVGAFRIIRIDVLSVESGVTERRYDDRGTTDVGDDVVTSEGFSFSRLGFVATGEWSHCWFDRSSFTDARVEKLRQRLAPAATRVVVLVNSDTFGGCNSGNVAVFSKGAGWITVAHELGHNLFFLDDEYTQDTKTFRGTSNRPNTTEQPAGGWNTLKWGALVDPAAALPTDAGALPAGWNARTSVGALEGAGGSFAHGLFRPVLECRMNQNDPPWCPVCAQQVDTTLGAFE